MNESGPSEAAGAGRPSLGAAMKDAFATDAWRREKGRDIRPLARLMPFVRSHPTDTILGLIFLTLSSVLALAMTWGARIVLDQGFTHHSRAELFQVFVVTGGIAILLAVTTGLRVYFLYKLGERVVADLRQVVFRHVLGLDLGHFRTWAMNSPRRQMTRLSILAMGEER